MHDWTRRLSRASRVRRSRIAAVALVLAAVLAAAPVCAAAGPQVKLVRERTPAGALLRFKVVVSSKVPLGAYTFQLSFDPSVLDLVGISGGARAFSGSPVANPQTFSSGIVRFSAFQPAVGGPKGLCHVATVIFRQRVTKGRTRLTIESITLADTLGTTYLSSKRARTLTLSRR